MFSPFLLSLRAPLVATTELWLDMQNANIHHKLSPYVFPIIGGRKVEHLHDNIKALSIKLSQEQIDSIEKVKAFDIGFPVSRDGFFVASVQPC